MAWATLPQARTHWRGSVSVDDDTVTDLLAAAEEACAEFAPALAVGEPVPFRYTLAVIYHAKELYEAATRAGDAINTEGFVIRARDLTATVKQLLRPKSGKLVMG